MKKHSQDFSCFLASRMGVQIAEASDEEAKQRHDAFLIFRRRTGRANIASLPTIRRWFGIGGYSLPDRYQIYRICFALHLSAEETEKFLLYGIHEPSFQVNDYQETIFAYGLHQHYTYEECEKLICQLELDMDTDASLIQTCSSQMLLEEFLSRRHLPQKEFMDWMRERSVYFKGYSKTTQNYFEKYKKIILNYIKQDAEKNLKRYMEETDYRQWCRRHPFLPDDEETKIQKYLTSHSTGNGKKLNEDLQKNIKEQLSMTYRYSDTNSRLWAEVFGLKQRKHISDAAKFSALPIITEKRLSDLLNIPILHERFIHARQTYRQLTEMNPEESCPKWALQAIQNCSPNASLPSDVRQAAEWLAHYLRENRRRCLQIRRSDLLPMILYVAQRRYLESIQYDIEQYDQQNATAQFEELANSTLAACSMCGLDPNYEQDAMMLSCFQSDEMLSYSEYLETIINGWS